MSAINTRIPTRMIRTEADSEATVRATADKHARKEGGGHVMDSQGNNPRATYSGRVDILLLPVDADVDVTDETRADVMPLVVVIARDQQVDDDLDTLVELLRRTRLAGELRDLIRRWREPSNQSRGDNE